MARTVPQLAQALTDSFSHEARPCTPCRKRKTAQGKASWPAGHLRASHSRASRAICRRPSNLDFTFSVAAVIIDCLDFLQHGGRSRPHLVGRCRPRTRSTAYKQLCLSSHKLRGPRCLSSRNRTNRQFLTRSSPLQAVSPEKDCAGQSFVARGPPACFGQPRAASASTTALTCSLSCKARPYEQSQDSAGPPQLSSPLYKQLRKTVVPQLAQAAWPAVEKDCAGQSFVARGPPVCFGQPQAASAKLAPIQAASQDSRAKLSHKH